MQMHPPTPGGSGLSQEIKIMSMSKTAAIKAARNAVGSPCGRGTSWQVYGPYYSTEEGLRGPSCSANADSYWKARAVRTRWVASLALQLMGWNSESAEWEIQDATGSVDDIISGALSRGPRFAE